MLFRRLILHRPLLQRVSRSRSTGGRLVQEGPGLSDFLQKSAVPKLDVDLDSVQSRLSGMKYFIETYGCQMNVSDSEIVRSILHENGHVLASSAENADIVMLNTCAIRENAEGKIWGRLSYFQHLRRERKSMLGNRKIRKALEQQGVSTRSKPFVGVLGCMAERLKDRLLDEESVDFVVGPDAYRDIPRLVDTVSSTGQKEANTRLSLEETYADIAPVREAESCSAFVSIMRGCNNMCSYCIVPFTRGRERSRQTNSIVREIKQLIEQGVKEVCLLGQNVNGFHDSSRESAELYPSTTYQAAKGFSNIYKGKSRDAPGARFADLLETVASLDPELRVRFTSPHPKDFSDDVLSAIAKYPNICKSLHLPAQSGSSSVLERMRRGYSREAYLDLFNRAKEIIPGVTISTDMITGFCGETEQEHEDSLSLMEQCAFDQGFLFAYSLREKTHADRSELMSDDVPEEIKQRRLQEVIEVFRRQLQLRNSTTETFQCRLVLVEGHATRSTPESPMLTGRTDGNKRVIFPAHNAVLPCGSVGTESVKELERFLESEARAIKEDIGRTEGEVQPGDLMHALTKKLEKKIYTLTSRNNYKNVVVQKHSEEEETQMNFRPGQYAAVFIAEAEGPTLRGTAYAMSSMVQWRSRDDAL